MVDAITLRDRVNGILTYTGFDAGIPRRVVLQLFGSRRNGPTEKLNYNNIGTLILC